MGFNQDAAKTHLRSVRDTINNFSDPTKMNTIMANHTLDLFNVLGDKKIDIDGDVKNIINHIYSKLGASGTTFTTTVAAEIRKIDTQIGLINANKKGNADAIKSLNDRKLLLTSLKSGNLTDRATEITKLHNHISTFNIDGEIKEDTVDVSVTPPTVSGTFWPQNLKNKFFGTSIPPSTPAYTLSTLEGEKLLGDNTIGYEISIGGTAYTVKGLTIDTSTSELKLDTRTFSITPQPNYPFELTMAVSAAFDNIDVGGETITIKDTKPFKLTLNSGAPLIKMDTKALREDEIDTYNTSGPTPGVIQRSLDATYTNDLIKLEKEAIFNALKKLDGSKFEKLNDAQKDELFAQFRTRFDDPSIVIDGINLHHHIRDINNYDRMKNWMSDDKHASNTPEHTKSKEAYRNYVHNNLEDQTGKYISAQLDTVFSDNLEINMYLKSELSNFFTNIENRKVDNNTHADIYQTLSDDAMESKKVFGLFGRKDANYLRFFEGKNSETIKGAVKINTEREGLVSGKKYPDPIDYDISVAVKKNSVQSSIRIPGMKDITLKGREPNAIIREILRRKDIPFGKLRMGIAYSFLKAMVQMASDSHINLDYTDPRSGEKRRIRMEESKIIIEQYDDNTQNNSGGGYRRLETIAFDETMFENSQEWDSSVENRSLRRGIEYLSQEFNCAMNQTHRHYKAATERKRFGLKKGEMRTTLPTSFFLSPIKSIRKWFGEKMDFPFTTSVSSGGKTANIEFTGKQFKITMGEKTYTNNNLGSILHKREGGVRIFDGIEREICATVYKKLIEGIRGNKRVENKNFGVVDPMTKGVYMIDVDGDRSYIEPEDKKRANIKRSKFMKGVVGAALGASAGVGAGVGGALWAGAGLVKGGWIGTRVGALAGGLLGGATAKNNYGEIPNPPTTRRVLSDKEKEQLYHNPLLMSRIMRAMSDGLR